MAMDSTVALQAFQKHLPLTAQCVGVLFYVFHHTAVRKQRSPDTESCVENLDLAYHF